MRLIRLAVVAASLMIAMAGHAAETSRCQTEGYGPSHYEVYVDEPTGYAFAFVMTPRVWHFVRQIPRERIAEAIELARTSPPAATETDAMANARDRDPKEFRSR